MRSSVGSITKSLLLKEFSLEPPSRRWEPLVTVRQLLNSRATIFPLLLLSIRDILSRLASRAKAPAGELLERAQKTEGDGELTEMAKIGTKNAWDRKGRRWVTKLSDRRKASSGLSGEMKSLEGRGDLNKRRGLAQLWWRISLG